MVTHGKEVSVSARYEKKASELPSTLLKEKAYF
jgi:hypothetical protein